MGEKLESDDNGEAEELVEPEEEAVGELPKLPNDTYNRTYGSNIDTHVKTLVQ